MEQGASGSHTFTLFGQNEVVCRRAAMRLCSTFANVSPVEALPRPDATRREEGYAFSQKFALRAGPRITDVSQGMQSIVGALKAAGTQCDYSLAYQRGQADAPYKRWELNLAIMPERCA
jgi:hypothetical protein